MEGSPEIRVYIQTERDMYDYEVERKLSYWRMLVVQVEKGRER